MLVGFLLAGCATWTAHVVTIDPQQKLRIAVLPVQSDFDIKSSNDIQTVPESTKEIPDEKERIRQEMQRLRKI